MRRTGAAIASLTALVVFAGPIHAEADYKKFEFRTGEEVRLELIVDQDEWVFIVRDDGTETIYEYSVTDILREEDAILAGREITLSDEGLQFPDCFIPAEDILGIRIEPGVEAGETRMLFIARDTTEYQSRFRRKISDRVSFFGGVTVAADEFVRGSVVSFFGDIEILGEVNEDVVAVFGDVVIGPEAVVRGDVVSVSGKVELQSGASVYGIIKSSEGKTSTRRHRARRWKGYYKNQVDMTGAVYYNRVDGPMLWGGVKYEHADSIIPWFEAVAGYAFGSSRWRYRLGLTQTVLRGPAPVQIGGNVFRELKSDDDKFISETENSVFALTVNEDWKDYYESEGAYGFVRVSPLGWNEFEVGYLSEEQRWMDAHPKLWSLFGAKEFRGNFSSVPYDTLRHRRSLFDERQINSLLLSCRIDTRDDEKHPGRGWHGFARYEFSPDRWKGDFDFKRFEARVKRFQPLGEYVSVHVTGAYGYAEGDDIPLSRLFYLGGLGTIHGYDHKEFIGAGYACAGIEYRFRLPKTEIVPFVLYDGGRITRGQMAGDDDWYSSIGIGADISRSFRLFLSKRLDSGDHDPVIYARFSAVVL